MWKAEQSTASSWLRRSHVRVGGGERIIDNPLTYITSPLLREGRVVDSEAHVKRHPLSSEAVVCSFTTLGTHSAIHPSQLIG